jgi:fucose 4-O-acetylase-like acetyltransferase
MLDPFRRLADETPATRDRYVDFLRAVSILIVVVGHWLISLIHWTDEFVFVTSAIGLTPGLWLATWILQVMPVFFFVGGFANLVGYERLRERGASSWEFLRRRMGRLLRPTAIFVAVWLVAQVVLHLADVGGGRVIRGVRFGTMPFGPLWFLGVYVVVVLLSPITIRLHRRFGLAVPATLVAVTIAGDVVGFGMEIWEARWVNLATVWILAHQLGYFYADGSLERLGHRGLVLMAVVGLIGLTTLTSTEVYPRSMLGTDVEPVSNMNPPTVNIMLLTFWLVGLVMLLREPARRWLERQGPWAAVIAANSVIMTLFLWHMTAFLVAVLALHPLGLGQPTEPTIRWWAERPIWVVAPGIALAAFVALFGRFERGGGGISHARDARRRRAGT